MMFKLSLCLGKEVLLSYKNFLEKLNLTKMLGIMVK